MMVNFHNAGKLVLPFILPSHKSNEFMGRELLTSASQREGM